MDYICSDCPRRCGARRTEERGFGVCASPAAIRVARAAPHFGEEPCISGTRGSGAIFFTGCSLRCVFCQNHDISRGQGGRAISVQELRDIMLRLRDAGVHNINLVTPSHYIHQIAEALDGLELGIPVVWNSSGYDSAEMLQRLEGLVQVYMPDLKYSDPELARRYSAAPDYPEIAMAAIREMYRQTGAYVMDSDGLLRSGVLIRHLILPEQDLNTKEVINFIEEEFGGEGVLFSLMSQYTPMPGLDRFPELCQRVDPAENQRLINYMARHGIENGYWQEPESATDDLIPSFDLTGV